MLPKVYTGPFSRKNKQWGTMNKKSVQNFILFPENLKRTSCSKFSLKNCCSGGSVSTCYTRSPVMRLELGHMKVLPSVSVVKALLKLVLLTLVLPCRTAGASDVLFIETRLNSNNISCTSSCSNAESWDLGQQNITRRTPEQDGGDALDPRLPIWTLRNENGSIIVPARAPGSVHLVRKNAARLIQKTEILP